MDVLKDCTGLSVKEVIMLLEFCLSATFLSIRGGVYQQTFGTAMGSPVSVTIANLVMEDVEERALATTDIPLRFWKCYVDDTCAALPASMEWNPVSSSRLRWNQKGSCHFWMSSFNGTQMAPSQQLYTGKPPTLTAT